MAPPPPVQWVAITLAFVPVLPVLIIAGLRRTAGDERRQGAAIRLVIALLLRRLLRTRLLLVARIRRLLLTVMRLLIAILIVIGLLIAWLKLIVALRLGRLRVAAAAVTRFARRLKIFAIIVEVLVALLLAIRTVERLLLALAELILRRGDHPEIVLRVLIVIFRRHRIAGSLRIACELNVFLRHMRGRAANLDVRSV